jgi:putative hydrolase of the HAD superfamily
MHMGGLRAQVRAVAHHAELLASLRQQARVGLCSNFSHSPTALRVLAESGLDAHLDAVVISEEVGIRKPRPEIFRAVLEALDVAPEETLHVGDSLDADVRGAAAVGIRTVWITRRVRDPEAVLARFDGPAPDWQIADLAELSSIVAGAAPAA